jgi:hypothetical protein
MATTVARLEAVLGADTRAFDRAMDRSEGKTKSFGSHLGNLAKTAGVAAGVAGIGAVAYTLKTGLKEWTESTKVAAQTRAVIKSTGGVANVTAKQVSGLSTALMKKSGTDDEAIASGENLLLTFKNIRNEVGRGNDIFTQATKATLDLSVAFHKDMHSSAILVGKALNDPIKGLTALQRVGVTFTSAQKEQIKALENSGHHLQAQKIIMKELRSEVGGSAEAYGKTLPGMISIARESFNNFAGDLIQKMIPILMRIVTWVRQNWPQISAVFSQTWAAIKPLIGALGTLIVSVVTTIRNHWGTIGPIVTAVVGIIRTQLKIVSGIIQVFAAVLRGDWSEAWKQLKGIATNAFSLVKQEILLAKDIIFAAVGAVGHAVWNGFKAALNAGWQGVKGVITGLFGKVVGWVKDVLGISSPSSVFHEIGRNSIQGFINGVGSMGGVLKKAVVRMVESLPSQALGAATGVIGAIPGAKGTIVGEGSKSGVHASPALAKQFAVTQMKVFGWGPSQMAALEPLWNGESGWRWNAENQSSGAYGIPQSLPASKMASAGKDWHENAFTQILWGLRYIKDRYGSPSAAYGAWQSRSPHWYDKGGWLPTGLSLAMNNTGRPERVLGPGEGGENHFHFYAPVGSERDLMAWVQQAADQWQRSNGGRSVF